MSVTPTCHEEITALPSLRIVLIPKLRFIMNNHLRTILLISLLSALVIGVGAAVAPSYVYLFVALAVAMNVGGYFFSDKIVLRMHGARELSPSEAPELHEMLTELAARAKLPKPRLFLIADRQPNAFATGRNPEHGVVAVTEGIMELLTLRELRGVLAHELAHIKNRDILLSSIAAVMVSIVTGIANALSLASLFGSSNSDSENEGGNALGGLFLALVAPIAATLIQLGISRSREYLADEVGAQISGDHEALAFALKKLERGAQVIPTEQPHPATSSMFIVNPLAGAGAIIKLFSTHPPTEERVARLFAMARVKRTAGKSPVTRLRSLFQ
jgi:heat shock protein HtpX